MTPEYLYSISPASVTYRSAKERDHRIPTINYGANAILKSLPHKAKVAGRITRLDDDQHVDGVLTNYGNTQGQLYGGADMRLPGGWSLRSNAEYRFDFTPVESVERNKAELMAEPAAAAMAP